MTNKYKIFNVNGTYHKLVDTATNQDVAHIGDVNGKWYVAEVASRDEHNRGKTFGPKVFISKAVALDDAALANFLGLTQ